MKNLDIYALRSALEDALDSLDDVESRMEYEEKKIFITEEDLTDVLEVLDEFIRDLFDKSPQYYLRRRQLEELAKRLETRYQEN